MADKANKRRFYESVLKTARDADFLTSADKVRERMAGSVPDWEGKGFDGESLLSATAYVTAPVLTAFVAWALFDARERGLRRLYFLARDGFVLYQIALEMCRACGIELECRYLYCSRYALRLPAYLISKENAPNMIFEPGGFVTAATALARAGISPGDASDLLRGIAVEDGARLERAGLNALRERLLHETDFEKMALEAAKIGMEGLKGYLGQEMGDTKGMAFGLVDSGWNGSMQKNIFLAYQSIFGAEPNVEGYYFGMYTRLSPRYGRCHALFFSPDADFRRLSRFNNNLFECMCSADHGMTTGYRQEGGTWVPVFKPTPPNPFAEAQTAVCAAYAKAFAETNPAFDRAPRFTDQTARLLRGLMICPSREEARLYGGIMFCDDATEKRMVNLAAPLTIRGYWEHSVARKVLNKLLGRGAARPSAPPFWTEGSIALSPRGKALMKADAWVMRLLLPNWHRRRAKNS